MQRDRPACPWAMLWFTHMHTQNIDFRFSSQARSIQITIKRKSRSTNYKSKADDTQLQSMFARSGRFPTRPSGPSEPKKTHQTVSNEATTGHFPGQDHASCSHPRPHRRQHGRSGHPTIVRRTPVARRNGRSSRRRNGHQSLHLRQIPVPAERSQYALHPSGRDRPGDLWRQPLDPAHG